MTRLNAAVFSCPGLGDGLISLVLSNNLHLNGWEVKTYHDGNLIELQNWLPHLPVEKFPDSASIPSLFYHYDKVFVSYDEKNPFIKSLILFGKEHHPEKICILNPSPTSKIGSQIYYEDSQFDPRINMVDNLVSFCKTVLHLEKTTEDCGLIIPQSLMESPKDSERIIVHPESARETRNWPKHKFLQLAHILKQKGFHITFVVSPKEYTKWKFINHEVKTFENFDELAKFVYNAALIIGNDSGIGHLASALGVKTIIICRNYRVAKLWKPGWTKGEVLYPHPWIPNFAPFRFRDKHWKKWVSVKKVLKAFSFIQQKVSV